MNSTIAQFTLMFYASWPGIWRTQTADKEMGDETCHRLPIQTSQAYSRV